MKEDNTNFDGGHSPKIPPSGSPPNVPPVNAMVGRPVQVAEELLSMIERLTGMIDKLTDRVIELERKE